ncbi:flavin reductase family protein [Actinomadura sp. 9N215]|uniref:flavin reductase family protein n=1 Tax=Actinomadura sp. 9N215 TaxID=3375150 RepID=UPI003788B657
MTTHSVEPSQAELRAALGHFATGVAAVTGLSEGASTGLAVNSFTSVSLVPPLVSFCVAHTSLTWPRLRRSGRICVNILGEHQHETSRRLASSGGDKFRGLSWTASPSGLPILDESIAWLECDVETHHPAGDHDIVVARVHHLETRANTGPLIFYRGRYGTFTPSLTQDARSEHP